MTACIRAVSYVTLLFSFYVSVTNSQLAAFGKFSSQREIDENANVLDNLHVVM